MSDNMNAGAKGVLLVVGSYIVTMVVATFIVIVAIMILLMESHSCNEMSRAMLVLWTIIAVVFLVSVVVAGLVSRKFIANRQGRIATMLIYGGAMLISYVIIAFGLLVVFNC